MMSNPFDWTAGPFLTLYAILAVALFAAGLALRWSIGAAAATRPHLNELEWAYLAGGADRVCDVALLCLSSQAAATVADKGRRIVVTDPAPLAAMAGDPWALRPGAEMTRADFRHAIEPAVRRLTGRLQALGLSPTDEQMNGLRLSILPFAGLLLTFGAIKAYVGASRQHPVGFLLFFLVATLFATIWLVRRPTRTRAGDEALSAHRAANARSSRAPLDRELLLAVALSGSVVLAGTAYASIHEASRAAREGGSSCSGGGCGGGGGGGCGGCS